MKELETIESKTINSIKTVKVKVKLPLSLKGIKKGFKNKISKLKKILGK